MESFALRDWLQLAGLVFIGGAFVNESRSTRIIVGELKKEIGMLVDRVGSAEKSHAATAIVLERTVLMLDALADRFQRHVDNSQCAEHGAAIRESRAVQAGIISELNRLRDRVDGDGAQ